MLSKINIILVLSLIVCLVPHHVNAASDRRSIGETILKAREREQERLSNDNLLLKIKQVRDNIFDRANENISLVKELEEKCSEHFDRMEVVLHSDDGKRIYDTEIVDCNGNIYSVMKGYKMINTGELEEGNKFK